MCVKNAEQLSKKYINKTYVYHTVGPQRFLYLKSLMFILILFVGNKTHTQTAMAPHITSRHLFLTNNRRIV